MSSMRSPGSSSVVPVTEMCRRPEDMKTTLGLGEPYSRQGLDQVIPVDGREAISEHHEVK